MSRETGARRGLFAELAGVVLGVFVALGADSWWSARQEHVQPRPRRASSWSG